MDSDTDALRRMMDITSDSQRTYEGKLESLLRLGCEYLGVEVGFLTRIEDGMQVVVEAVGDHDLLQPGEQCPLSESYCRRTIETTESLPVQQASIEGWEDDPAYAMFGLEAYVGARVELEGDLYGTFCFADREPREEPFSESEVVFVELLAEWVSHELARQAVIADLERERDRLEEFADVVAHDLRNPLSVADGELALAQADAEDDNLQRAKQALDRMDDLLGDLLTMAKAGEAIGRLESVSLEAVAEQRWETVETGTTTLVCEADTTVLADPVRLGQVFENLFRNAVEHGSSETVEGVMRGAATASSGSAATDSAVTVTVRDIEGGFAVDDDGPGIPPVERDAVLEPGFTTSNDGNGLGLHIVDQVARAHDWALEVTESPDGGARFKFTGVATRTGELDATETE